MARYLALDWDQNLLHVVAADVSKGSVRVKKVVVSHETLGPMASGAEELGKILKDRLREAGISPAPVVACVGRDKLIVKEVRYPAVPELEEPAVVRFQAVKELTESAEDVIIDYVLAGSARSTLTSDRKAVALVIRKEILEAYRTICEAAGLKLAGLTPRLVGMGACLRKVMGTTVVTPAPTPPDGVVTVVVVGEKQAEITILKDDVILLARSVPNNANLSGEIRRNLAVHAGQSAQMPVAAVYVTGRGAGELVKRLGEQLEDVPVYTFDPFAAAGTVEVLELQAAVPRTATTPAERLDAADAPKPGGNRGTFAGAMGLLYLKSAGELPVNFVSPRQATPPANPNYRLLRLAGVAVALLFVGIFGIGLALQASWQDTLDQTEGLTKDVEGQLAKTKENAKLLKTLDDWETVVVLDELYDLAAHINDVNALRINSIQVEPVARTGKTVTKSAAKVTLKGRLVNRRDGRAPLDELIKSLKDEGYYSNDVPVINPETNDFTLVVSIERRAPVDYKKQVEVKAAQAKAPAEDAKEGEEEDPEAVMRELKKKAAEEKANKKNVGKVKAPDAGGDKGGGKDKGNKGKNRQRGG